jgi:hypothetical protein
MVFNALEVFPRAKRDGSGRWSMMASLMMLFDSRVISSGGKDAASIVRVEVLAKSVPWNQVVNEGAV